jgi:hypothetical protein
VIKSLTVEFLNTETSGSNTSAFYRIKSFVGLRLGCAILEGKGVCGIPRKAIALDCSSFPHPIDDLQTLVIIMKWRVILEPDPEIGNWSVWCPELPGCISAGDSKKL